MVDWETIEIEYVTTDISHRKLAEKYNVCRSTVCKKAAAEKWSEKREKHRAKLVSKAVNAVGNKQAERAAKLVIVSDLLLDKIKSLLEDNPELLVNPQNMKHISGVLKDIKDIQMIKSEADMREQEARIEKLRKDAAGDEDKKQQTVTVIMGGDAEKYAD